MSLTLYDLSHSPFCLPIKRLLEALNQPYGVVDVPNWDRRAVIELTKGAYYQVPVLVHEDRVLFETGGDTQDIARYLDQTFAGGRLFPAAQEGLQSILLTYLENDVEGATFRAADALYVDSITDLVGRTMVLRHKERKFGRGCVAQWKANIAGLRAEAESHFRRFDQILQHQPFLLGDAPVYADFLLHGIIGNYTWKNWNELPEEMAALKDWQTRLSQFRF